MKDGLGADPPLGQPPAGIAHPRRPIAAEAVANEIDIDIVVASRPVPAEIIEEGWPVGLQAISLEVAQR